MFKRICIALLLMPPLAGCGGDIYLRDGVTDGDTFYLSPQALTDAEPVLQSWVSYSLTKSACQLQLGGNNPARMNSFDCEVTARRHLVESWDAKRNIDEPAFDTYLDALLKITQAGYLNEYVVRYFSQTGWSIPVDLDLAAFDRWQRNNVPRHRPETRLTGSWNYARRVSSSARRE